MITGIRAPLPPARRRPSITPNEKRRRATSAPAREAAKPVHEGSFAEGQEAVEHHPELPDNKGDFAEGQEEEHSHPS
jgi:hypothetical protein